MSSTYQLASGRDLLDDCVHCGVWFGVHHGAYCAACCWALMAIQLALGVMSLPLMAAVAIVIFLEKCWKHGEALAIVIGIAAIVWGALLVLRAAS